VTVDSGGCPYEALTMRQVTYTCATYEKGCPCNEEWEIECESYGYKERLHVSTRGIAGKDKHNQVMIWV
jgi:hypothetical protein